MAAAPATSPAPRVGPVADATIRGSPRAVSDAEGFDRYGALCEHQGKRVYSQRRENVMNLYGVIRLRHFATGETTGVMSYRQLGNRLYHDVETIEDGRRKVASMRRWAADLRAMGLLEITVEENAAGRTVGIRWRLLDPDTLAPGARSSAG